MVMTVIKRRILNSVVLAAFGRSYDPPHDSGPGVLVSQVPGVEGLDKGEEHKLG